MSRQELNTGPRAYLVGYGKGGVKPWPELIEGPSRKAVLKEVGRAVAAGELAAAGPLEHVGGGRYQVAVWRIKERPVAPRWQRPVLVASVAVGALSGLAGLGWWLAGVAAVAVGAVSAPLAVGLATAAVLMWLALRRGNPTGGECETTVTIRHRHR